ncbi:antibiotic biosynthesis monooxygenase [Shimia sp.]|uniref:antibiotic biosynthesis monooxygenase family protein n=1 Tax=Shimia sp. TaxID=1954381 RepID=UPI00329893C7
MSRFAPLPDPPYYAVIFTAQRTEGDFGYGAMADQMGEMAAQQPGYLGDESTRDDQGFGITVSYWRDEESLVNWKDVANHLLAQKLGKTRWYSYYTVRIAKVERAYSGPDDR